LNSCAAPYIITSHGGAPAEFSAGIRAARWPESGMGSLPETPMIQYKVENITLTDDEKSFLIDLTIELEDYESDPVLISLSFPLANDSGDVEDIKDKAVIHAKSLLKKVLLEDAQRELF